MTDTKRSGTLKRPAAEVTMKKVRRKFTKDFKIQAVAAMKDTDRSHTEIAEELGISASLLYKWRDKLEEKGEDAFPGSGNLAGKDKQIAELQKELEKVRQERDFLRRAATYFAKGSL